LTITQKHGEAATGLPRWVRSGLGVVLAACGSASRGPVIERAPEAPPSVMTGATSTTIRLSSENRAIETVIRVSVDSAWNRLGPVWRTLSIPVAQVDRASLTYRSPRFRAPRFAGRPLREFVDCGQSIAGARADLWDVYLEVTTAVRLAGTPNETRVSSAVVGSARPRDGSSTQPVPCASLGKLESVIAVQLQSGS